MNNKLINLVIISLFSTGAFAQSNADMLAINKVIDQYCNTEADGDMMTQAKLMSADRVWIGGQGAGRMTDQKKNMEMQQKQYDEGKKWLPGVSWNFDARDRLIKTYGNGNVAVASFYWYVSYVLPSSATSEQAAAYGTIDPSVISLVLEKNGSDWKIVHTHVSSMKD